jgi:hypothetical protein
MRRMLLITLVLSGVAVAQTSRSRPNDVSSTSGKVYMDVDFPTVPLTAEELIAESDLIVQGRVLALLPSVRRAPKSPSIIETDSLIGVTSVLAGQLPLGVTTLAVTQFGGRIGDLEAVFSNDPLMTVGEAYIFFLKRKTGAEATAEGYARYMPAGGWIGKAKVAADGTVSFPEKARGAGLTALNGLKLSDFLSKIAQKIALHATVKGVTNAK